MFIYIYLENSAIIPNYAFVFYAYLLELTPMKPELVQAFMLKNGECFDMMAVQDVQNKLTEVDDSKYALLMSMSLQKPTVMLIIAIVLGWERFFLDDIGLGVVKVITCYGCGIWWLIDIFSAQRRTYEYNYKKFNETLMLCK